MQPRHSILLVDDEPGPREALTLILKPFYGVYAATNGKEAMEFLRTKPVDLVILDMKMPGLQGTDVLREAKNIDQNIEVIILTGYGSMKTAVDSLKLGATDYILKPFNIAEMMSVVRRAMSKKEQRDGLKHFLNQLGKVFGYESSIGQIRSVLSESPDLLDSFRDFLSPPDQTEKYSHQSVSLDFIRNLADTLEKKDPYTYGHSGRIHFYSSLLAQRIKLGEDDQKDLQIGAYLHDIGNLGINANTLYKNGPYTREEQMLIRKHVEIGFSLIAPMGFPQGVSTIIRNHHELFNGSGYPDGLKGEEIPILARIVGISETLDAMITDRPYRKAMELDQVIYELKRCSGVQLDPNLAGYLVDIIEEKGDGLLPKHLQSTRPLSN